MTTQFPHLHDLLFIHTGFNVPLRAVCPEHHAPADYLAAALEPVGRDLLVWACRGGGKTLLAAVVTWHELLRTPGRSVRILAGSKEQGRRMLEYLHLLAEVEGEGQVLARTQNALQLSNGSEVDVLAHAETSVRGHHVDVLRCDEIELFDPEVFSAAMFTADRAGAGGLSRGRLEALSTMHRVGGLMSKLVADATPKTKENGWKAKTGSHSTVPPSSVLDAPSSGMHLIRWCLLDVLERCPPSRQCEGCVLWDDCAGRVRQATGFYPIESAIRLKGRVSRAAWDAEALCRRPSTEDAVFPTFDPVRHVAPAGYDPRLPLYRTMDLGFTNPSVCLWLQRDEAGRVRVMDELVVRRTMLGELARQILERTPGPVSATFCDPAAGQHGLVTARSVADELRRCGVPVRFQPSRIADGIEQIRAALERSPTPAGTPGLLIAPQCTTLIASLSNYRYPRPGEPGDREKPVKDGEHDHAVDALRYFFVGINGAQPVKRGRY